MPRAKVINEKVAMVLTFVVVLMIFFIAYFIFLQPQAEHYDFEIEKEGVLFVSNDMHPSDLLDNYKEHTTFIVSPQLVEAGTVNQYMSQAMNLFSTILVANGKTVILMPRLFGDSGEFISCYTNDGNVYQNREITVDECNNSLNNPAVTRVLISFPDGRLQKSRVVLSENEILVEPNNYNDAMRVPMVVLKAMYADSEEVIRRINDVLNQLNAGVS